MELTKPPGRVQILKRLEDQSGGERSQDIELFSLKKGECHRTCLKPDQFLSMFREGRITEMWLKLNS